MFATDYMKEREKLAGVFGLDDCSYVVSSVLGKVAEQSYCSDHLMSIRKNSQYAVQLGDDDVSQSNYTFHLHLFPPPKNQRPTNVGIFL